VATPEKRRFENPDETRSFADGKADVLSIGDRSLMLLTFQPTFKWSTSLKSTIKTDSCQVAHVWYVVSGRMHIKMDDGSEQEYGPGDLANVPAGHDGWTVGSEPAVLLDMQGAAEFAKQ
jgi:mannose-6-phosphate isomerase-like protein (cupin superfamily)